MLYRQIFRRCKNDNKNSHCAAAKQNEWRSLYLCLAVLWFNERLFLKGVPAQRVNLRLMMNRAANAGESPMFEML
ncbi:hypothetical protein RJ47_03020 [Vibrio sinaloensis]|nr:hypothetical protein RJ47_03020 [Vibrio sinaloensis]